MIKKILGVCTVCFLFLPCCASDSFSIKNMSLEEKVGQLLMVHFHGEEVNEDAKALVQETHVGGIIYYNWANGLHSPEQVADLSAGLQQLAQIPLLIAVDQEGGLVSRLTEGFTVFPGNRALGMTGDPTLAEECAFAMGQELFSVGVNFNLSPVVDVNSNPSNPIIGIRSFGETADSVIPFAAQALKGYHRAHIITSLKHFPGYGEVSLDPHEDLPVIYKSRPELERLELLPFLKLAPQADTIMTAHVIVPALDPIHCTTLSRETLTLLRKEMGFQGVIVTDSLVMEGLLKNCSSVEDAAIRALNAGCDLLLLGGKQLTGAHASFELTREEMQRVHHALVQAVQGGLISEKRLNEAVTRILNLKNRYALSRAHSSKGRVSTPEHQQLSEKIAALALKVIQKRPIPLTSLDQCTFAVFAPSIARESILQTMLLNLSDQTRVLFFEGLNPTDKEIQEAKEIAQQADLLIFCSYNAWKNRAQATLLESLADTKKPFVLLSLRDTLDMSLGSQANLILMTSSPTAPSIQAACQRLQDAFEWRE